MADPGAWIGFDLDDVDGSKVGLVHSVYRDAGSGEPAWLVVKVGRRRGKLVAVRARDCAGAAGRVWAAHGRDALRSAPAVDPSRPLLREHELAICAHYGIGEGAGRAAEVARLPAGSVTSHPAG